MKWHTETVAWERLSAVLAAIRSAGGTVTRWLPHGDAVQVTWTTA